MKCSHSLLFDCALLYFIVVFSNLLIFSKYIFFCLVSTRTRQHKILQLNMKKTTVSKQAAERDYNSNRKSEKLPQRQKKSPKVQSNSHVCGEFQTVFDILLPIEVLKPLSAKSSNDVKEINQLPEKLEKEKEPGDVVGDQDALETDRDRGTGDAGTVLELRELSDEEVEEENKDFQLGVEVSPHSKINNLNKNTTNKRANIGKLNKRVSFDMKKMKLTQQNKNRITSNEDKSKLKDDRKKSKGRERLNKAASDAAAENTEISRHDWLLEAEEKQEIFENLGISTASAIKAQYEENENGDDAMLMAVETVKPLESIPESVAEETCGNDARDFGAESESSEDSEDDVELPSEVQEMEKKIYELTAAIEKARSKIRMFHKKRQLNDETEAEIQELKSYIKDSLTELELYSSRIKDLLNINKQKPITEFISDTQKTYMLNENKTSNKEENYLQNSDMLEAISLQIEKPESNVEENESTINGNTKLKNSSDSKSDSILDKNEHHENTRNIILEENNSKRVHEESLNDEQAKLNGGLWTLNDKSVSEIENKPIDTSQITNHFNQTEKGNDSDCCIDCIPYNSALESGKRSEVMSDWQLQERFITSNKEVGMESSNWIACDSKLTFDQSDEEHIINQTFPLQDTIPKVIICGSRDDVPRIILCDQIKPFKSEEKLVPELVMSLTSRLCNSYSLQEKLAVENAELEGGRYHLQQELLQKDGTVETLQNKVNSLQTELKIVSKENSVLNDKLAMLSQSEHNCPCSCWDKQIASSIEKEEAVDAKLYQYSIQMEEQLVKMWNDLRIVQLEMEQVLREKEQLEYQKHLLSQTHESPQDQLKAVKQQYSKLQEELGTKDEELRMLASEMEELKKTEENAQKVILDSEDCYNTLLDKLNNLETETLQTDVYKEESIILSKKLTTNNHTCDKYRYEIEEIRSQIEESAEQIEYYRRKHYDAQQRVEEQRHQIEDILCETNGIKEQINMQLQIVKGQYEDKIHDLAALPDKLKATQIKLQEAQQTRCFAETSCQDLVKELQNLKEEALKNAREMSIINSNLQQCAESEKDLYKKITESEKKNNELKKEISTLNKRVEHLDETNNFNEKHLQEKLKETYQLSKKIEATSEEYAHQHLRMKDRSEMNRLSLQGQISQLENELVESRSSAMTAQKERDEMRMKMQIKLDSLGKNYDEAQIRIRCLTTQIQCLQRTCTIMEPLRNDYLSTDDLASSTYVTAALCEAAK